MVWILIALAVLVVLALVAFGVIKGRSARLRQQFGPEYDRAVEAHGDRRQAEAGLRQVARKRDELDIRPLSVASRDGYVARWRAAQARFVDAPGRAVAEADALVGQVLRERGYPTGDFDEQAAMVAVDHGERADSYRRAYAVHRGEAGEAVTTDDLRDAFLGYRDVFQALVDAGDPSDAVDAHATPAPVDADGRHADLDLDGVDDREEERRLAEADLDGDGVDDRVEERRLAEADLDGDGVDDRVEERRLAEADLDGDGVDDRDEERRLAEAEMARRQDLEARVETARQAANRRTTR
jgi:hypothetical protein